MKINKAAEHVSEHGMGVFNSNMAVSVVGKIVAIRCDPDKYYRGRLIRHKKRYFVDIQDETGVISAVCWRSNLALNDTISATGMIVERENQPIDNTPNGRYELIVAYTLG